jgi:hypothetical protein
VVGLSYFFGFALILSFGESRIGIEKRFNNSGTCNIVVTELEDGE